MDPRRSTTKRGDGAPPDDPRWLDAGLASTCVPFLITPRALPRSRALGGDISKLNVPRRLQRNHPNVQAAGPPELTGQTLIDLSIERLGLVDLSDTDVLDIGCGVRFTQAIINNELPIKSYTGVDVEHEVIDFLQAHVSDPRFTFAHWKVQNAFYNPDAPPMTPDTPLPVDGRYDTIWMFSVVTHLPPDDAEVLLRILRRYVRPSGTLHFSSLLDAATETYREGDPERPGRQSIYNPDLLSTLAAGAGWRVERIYKPERFMQHGFLCRPA